MFGMVAVHQFVENAHPHLLLFAELDLKDELWVKAGTAEKGIVSKCNVIDGIVLPDRLRTVRACNRDVGARRVLRRLPSQAILEWVLKLTVRFDALFGDHEAGAAEVAATEFAWVVTDLVFRLIFGISRRRERHTTLTR